MDRYLRKTDEKMESYSRKTDEKIESHSKKTDERMDDLRPPAAYVTARTSLRGHVFSLMTGRWTSTWCAWSPLRR